METRHGQQQKLLDEIFKTFTIITVVFCPQMVCTVLMGQNVHVPGQYRDSLWPFMLIVMGTLLCTLAMFIKFKYFM
jgi:Mg2+ and Co2+ transporter CorA